MPLFFSQSPLPPRLQSQAEADSCWWDSCITSGIYIKVQRTVRKHAAVVEGGLEGVVVGRFMENRNYNTEIHTVLRLELVHRLFVDSR